MPTEWPLKRDGKPMANWELEAREHPAWEAFWKFLQLQSQASNRGFRGAKIEPRKWEWELFSAGYECQGESQPLRDGSRLCRSILEG